MIIIDRTELTSKVEPLHVLQVSRLASVFEGSIQDMTCNWNIIIFLFCHNIAYYIFI